MSFSADVQERMSAQSERKRKRSRQRGIIYAPHPPVVQFHRDSKHTLDDFLVITGDIISSRTDYSTRELIWM